VLASEFNSITTENALKWTTVHPEPDRFDFSGADSIASFCQSQHARLHGHNLVWYSYNPAWLNRFSGDSAAWARLLLGRSQ
jgi:endo-1,4-beta-xylanase